MGCVHSRRIKNHGAHTLMAEDPEVLPEILQLAELAKAGSHTFTRKNFKKGRACDVCQQDIINPGSFCKECRVAVHKMCETKVSPACALIPDQTSTKTGSLRKRGSMPRSRSEEQVMENVMERHYDFDLTYITERIISVFFLPELEEEQYHRDIQEVSSMLKSKHQDKFLLLNLSEKRHDITRLNQKVQDFGWPDLHAPPLDRICSVCKAMESWLVSDPLNVVVLHCKGHRGRTGVIVAAYMHYSKISAGADQALTTLAMRKFCEDKVTSSLQPSQNRYIYYFDGLLSGTIKMNSSPLFLHQILIPSLPNFQSGGGFYPFLKIYQSLQLVYTSGLYDPQASRTRKLCVTLEPALLLKGDIMVKCYHRRSQAAEREVVFRVQFHTCTVHGAQLWFGKTELDVASTDDRFPPDALVEFIFSNGPDKLKGQQAKPDVLVKVKNNTSDPVVRWDSYENLHQDSTESISHTRGPLDGSLYAQVRKRRGPGSTSSAASPNGCLTSSPTVTTHVPCKPQSVIYISDSQPSDRLEDHSGKERTMSPVRKEEHYSKAKEKERETEILDDADPSSPGGMRRGPSCCGRAGTKCGDMKWERERDLCLSNSHCLGRCSSIKKQAKSQTLPAIPSKSVSPPPHLAHVDLCHRHSSHPLPELPWERQPVPLPCLHRSCVPYSSPEHIHTHTLPTLNRLCPGEECHLLHYSNHGHSSHLSQPALPTSPYRELFFGSHTSSSGCACRECRSRREHQSARSFHPQHPDQQVGLQRTREAIPLWESENPWEVPRESEFWQCKPAMPSLCTCHPTAVDPALNLEQSRFSLGPPQNYPSPQSLVDVRDGASSGYHTPPAPRHSCPCTPYTASPVESHESRGYASGYQSGSASPLPASSPSPDRGRGPDVSPAGRDPKYTDSHIGENAKTFRGSENKSDSNDRSSSLGLDSDHDYTLIGGNSPTHSGGSVTPDFKEHQATSADIESPSANISTHATLPSVETTQNSDGNAADKAPMPDNIEPPQSSTLTVVTPVQVQLNGSTILVESPTDSSKAEPTASLSSSPSTASLNSPMDSPDPPQCSPSNADLAGQRLSLNRDSLTDTKPPSPVPDGYSTPTFPLASYYYPLLNVPHVPYTGYTAVTIPAIQPPLPEKKRLSSSPGVLNGHASVCRVASAPAPSPTHHVTFSVREQRRGSAQSLSREEGDTRVNAKFVQDSSKFWYKPGISRDQAIAVLKDKEPGSFLIRDSNSFQGAYGLALKVATPPPNANIAPMKGDPLEQLVRHFLIETGPRGVKIKGCQNESYFGSLSALVYQHSITPISLPCALRIPEKDLVGELQDMQTATSTSTAADLLKQGAACNVLYLNSVETESLTGPEAVSKATKCTLALNPRPVATVVHFKVSAQGITLTDSKRRLFFRRHYPISTITFSSLDPQDKRWTDSPSSKMFGFVARRAGCSTENVCHLFAEMDPEQPAVAIVNFINKVMLGPQLRR
ncbi:tensin-2-like isoform X1 [Synchiropus splendidus]|uniref:tensin-2-like isoform X1 n=2 Tax=Synchiropus splendidus TaxID=270530 RepID=UPI00237E6910|nr:tensin-2-like isoform X1 [Synchiropus splendidus]